MNYLKLPNLPDRKVKRVLIGSDCPKDIQHTIESYGIKTLKSVNLSLIEDATSTHPDMSILHLGDNKFICAKSSLTYYQKILEDASVQALPEELKSPYPQDAGINAAILGKTVFYCKKSISEHIFEEVRRLNFRRIPVTQGYTKCNLVPISENALITEDMSIYNAAIKNGLDALRINPGSIYLKGYPYGFIGGACGKIDVGTLAITGKLAYIPEVESITAFCRNHGVEVVELCNSRPCDIGSILPIA